MALLRLVMKTMIFEMLRESSRAVDLVSKILFTVMPAFDKNLEGARVDNRTSAVHARHVLVSREYDLFEAMLQ